MSSFLRLLLALSITVALIIALDSRLPAGKTKTPRLGYFLSPQYGFWQNAESVHQSFDPNLHLAGLKNNADVYFDDRLVPHIYAANNADAYYLQGFLHAKFRLWQMEFQTYIAGGRLSEILGETALPTDRYLRRLGLLYGAEKSVAEMEANPLTKEACDAYTAGVNAYIKSIKREEIPFEYKLLDYQPEPWTNLKSALFLKLMSYDLTGQGDEDFLQTNTKNFFGYNTYRQLFPSQMDSLDPIIPKGTAFNPPSIIPKIPASFDSLYIGNKSSFNITIPLVPDKDNGSNNWAVSGSKTKSGRPILCNDPHLGLNLPSLWYEMQITTLTYSSYGVSFPGSPCVVIGFNDSCAWGVTNAGRDVKDFYEIQFKDSLMKEYWLNGHWEKSSNRREVIKVKGKPDQIENIAMTVFGPVMYDRTYQSINKTNKCYAVKWKAHEPSNELLTFYQLNRAKNHQDYESAINTYKCPGQNFAFASKTGDIAIKQQGEFVAKWKHQGEFVMPGNDSAYLWQANIPAAENVGMYNPQRGFVSSANQMIADSSFPYYLGEAGNFALYRGLLINKKLTALHQITVADMQAMQTSNENIFAEMALPVLTKYLDRNHLDAAQKNYYSLINSWNKQDNPEEKGATLFKLWWDSTMSMMYDDEYRKSVLPLRRPYQSTLLEALIRDSNYIFADNIDTKDKKETVGDIVTAAFIKATKAADSLTKINNLVWSRFKDTHVSHFTKIEALSRLHIMNGGSANCINATKPNNGPSWRMIVHLTDTIEAYGLYPGGQSGNPGSIYYDTFIDKWAAGTYYRLLFITQKQAVKEKRIKWHWEVS